MPELGKHVEETLCNLQFEDFAGSDDESCADGGRPDEHPHAGQVRISVVMDVWDYPYRDPREWDLETLAREAFGEHPDSVISVSVEEI